MTPVCLLFAAPDRSSLVDAINGLLDLPSADARARAIDALAASPPPDPQLPCRLAIVAPVEEAAASLELARSRLPALRQPRFVARANGVYFSGAADPGLVAFVFPGEGSEHVGMLRDLYRGCAPVRAWFDELDAAAREIEGRPLTPLIYPDGAAAPSGGPVGDMDRGAVLGTVAALALHDVLGRLGVRAHAHVGHSNGEHAAVIAAGRVRGPRGDLMRWLSELGEAGAALPRPARAERMLSIAALDRAHVQRLLADEEGRVFLAMDNSPHQTVAGGEADAVDRIAHAVIAAGGVALTLPFHHAFHTPLFQDWAAVLDRHYRRLAFGPGRLPVYSCFTTEPLPADADGLRCTMVAQWTAAVRFGATIERMHADGVRTFVEVGPGSALAPLIGDTLRGRPHVAVSTSDKRRGGFEQLHHLLAELFIAGIAVDPRTIAGLSARTPASSLPTLGRSIHEGLIAEVRQQAARFGVRLSGAAADEPPLLGRVLSSTSSALHARREFSIDADPFVRDHALGRSGSGPGSPLPVLAFTVSLEMVAEAASRLIGVPVHEIVDARASRWLALDEGGLVVDVQASAVTSSDVDVRLTEAAARTPLAAFEARASISRSSASTQLPRLVAATRPRRWTVRDFYARYAFHGPSFQTIADVRAIGPEGIEAALHTTVVPGLSGLGCQLDPALLDAAGQLVAFWLLEHHRLPPAFAIIPVAARRVVICARPPAPGTAVVCRGTMSRTQDSTDAAFVFETAGGQPLLAIEGFVQRLFELPQWLAQIIFGGASVSTIPARLADADRAVLAANWRIWARALAHLGVDRSFLDDEHDDAR